ncbi:MAG: hypothetical protein QOD84_998 [Acidobacteriaceae bacterium]|jgi:hypothetical protein
MTHKISFNGRVALGYAVRVCEIQGEAIYV